MSKQSFEPCSFGTLSSMQPSSARLHNWTVSLTRLLLAFLVVGLFYVQCKEESPTENPQENNSVGDFFPLKLGNWWKYDYSYSMIYGEEKVYIDGTKTWEIIDARMFTDSSQYTVREIFSGRRIGATLVWWEPYPYPWLYDTTYVPADTSFVYLSEDKEHKVNTIGMTATDYRSYLAISLSRFDSTGLVDSLTMQVPHYWSSTIKYVKNIGMVPYYWFSAGNHSYSEVYTLKEYRLQTDQRTGKMSKGFPRPVYFSDFAYKRIL